MSQFLMESLAFTHTTLTRRPHSGTYKLCKLDVASLSIVDKLHEVFIVLCLQFIVCCIIMIIIAWYKVGSRTIIHTQLSNHHVIGMDRGEHSRSLINNAANCRIWHQDTVTNTLAWASPVPHYGYWHCTDLEPDGTACRTNDLLAHCLLSSSAQLSFPRLGYNDNS